MSWRGLFRGLLHEPSRERELISADGVRFTVETVGDEFHLRLVRPRSLYVEYTEPPVRLTRAQLADLGRAIVAEVRLP